MGACECANVTSVFFNHLGSQTEANCGKANSEGLRVVEERGKWRQETCLRFRSLQAAFSENHLKA